MPIDPSKIEWENPESPDPSKVVWDQPEEPSFIQKVTRAFAGFITDPKRVGRLAFQAGGATAGGIIGSGVPVYGTVVGGGLGYALGDQLADVIYGERLPPEKVGKVSEQLKQTAEDIGTGLLYEAGGKAIDIAGKVLYAGERAIREVAKEGIRPAVGKVTEALTRKTAAKKIFETQTKTPIATSQIEKNIEQAEKLESEIPGLKFNIGQKTGDPNLLSLARQKSQQPGAPSSLSAESTMAQNEALTKYIDTHIRRNGNIDDFLMEIEKEQQRLAGKTATTVMETETQATKLLGKTEQEIGGKLLDKAERLKALDAKKAEQLYNQVPDNLKIEATPLWDKTEELFGGFDALTQRLGATPTGTMSRVKKAMEPEKTLKQSVLEQDMEPSRIIDVRGKQILSKEIELPPQLTMKQIKDFRSQISTAQRVAISSKDYELAYKLGQLKNGVNETLFLASKEGTGEGIEALRKATAFWRDVYVPKYRHGATGKILGIQKSGEQKISDSLIGEQYFKSGKGAGEAVDNFKLTFGADQESKELIRDYASQSLLKAARNPITGEFESKRIASWLYQHNEALIKHGLKNEFSNLENAMRIADKAKGVEAQFNKSSLAKALNVDPDKAIAEMLMTGTGRKQSIDRLKNMVDLSKNDKTGAAIEGLRAGIGDHFRNSIQITARDLANNKIESLAKIDKFMQNFKPAFEKSGLYTREEMKAFDNVHQSIITISKQQRPHPEFGGSQTFELLSRLAASGTSVAFGHIGMYGAAHGIYSLLERPMKDRIDYTLARAVFDPRFAQEINGLAWNMKRVFTTLGKGSQIKELSKAVDKFNRRLETLGLIVTAPKEEE